MYSTALADLETLRQVQTTESYGYVVKPFHSNAVRAAIGLALAKRERELQPLTGEGQAETCFDPLVAG